MIISPRRISFMMTNKNTLKCKCKESNLKIAVHYTKPPEGEVVQIPRTEKYDRYYLECMTCHHYFSRHKINLEKYI